MAVSIENFNAYQYSFPIIDSPRSVEACKRAGVDQEELLFKSKSEFRKELGKSADKSYVARKFDAYERRRQTKIQLVTQERRRLLRQGNKSSSTLLKSRSTPNMLQQPTMLDAERKLLEHIERKTQAEIQAMIEQQRIAEATRKNSEEKMKKQAEKEAKRKIELALKHKAQEKRRAAEEQRKRRAEEEEEAYAVQRAAEEYEKKQRFLQQEEKKKRQREKEAKRRMKLAQQKQIEFQQKTESIFAEQQYKLQIKKEEMDEKDEVRKATLARQQKQKRTESAERAAQKQAMLQAAQDNLAEINAAQLKEFARKQQKTEERRLAFEAERQRRNMEVHARAREKEEQIAYVLEKNKFLEDEKRQQYEAAAVEAQRRKQELERQASLERKLKRREEIERQAQRDEALQRAYHQESVRVSQLEKKRQISDSKLLMIRKKQAKDLEELRIERELNREEKEDNVRRIQKQQEYQRELIMQKIQADNARSLSLQREKSKIIEDRKKLRASVEVKKARIMQEFEETQSQGTGILHSSDVLSNMLRPGSNPGRRRKSQSSLTLGRRHKRRPARSKTAQGRRRRSRADGMAMAYDDYNGREISPEHELDTSPTPSPILASPESETFTQKVNIRPQTAKNAPMDLHSAPRERIYDKPFIKPRSSSTESQRHVNQAKSRKKIEKMRNRQNTQLVRLLKKQQKIENKREKMLDGADEDEREDLEAQFAVQRAKASKRIIKLSEKHDVALKKLARRLGVAVTAES